MAVVVAAEETIAAALSDEDDLSFPTVLKVVRVDMSFVVTLLPPPLLDADVERPCVDLAAVAADVEVDSRGEPSGESGLNLPALTTL